MDETLENAGDLETEFINEQKGEGSLSVFLTDGEDSEYIGWDINPEDLEAIYFEGIGVPRWESLEAGTVDAKTALYWEKFNALMDSLPMIGRIRDTDEKLEFTPEEVDHLFGECDEILLAAKHAKAQWSLKKISIAAAKAMDRKAGLRLTPSRAPEFPGLDR